MRIKFCRDPAFAPCCYLIAREREDGTFDHHDEATTILVGTDWDYPPVAQNFGWRMSALGMPDCDHRGTDGTVDCPDCGYTAGEFVMRAAEWLTENVGAVADDPGYF